MIKVAIVEDELLVRMGMKMSLENSNDVKVIGSFEHAEGFLASPIRDQTEILITDIRLSGIDGLQMVEKIRKYGLDMGIIVLSCYEEFSYARKAMELSVDKYLLKHELKEEELVSEVMRVYEKRKEKGWLHDYYKISLQQKSKKEGLMQSVGEEKNTMKYQYRVGCFSLRKENENIENDSINQEILGEIIQEILNKTGMGEYFSRKNGDTFLVIKSDFRETEEKNREKMFRLFERCSKSICDYFNKNFYLGLSYPFSDLKEVQIQYKSAKEIVTNSFYEEKSALFLAEDCVQRRKDRNSFLELDSEKILTEVWLNQFEKMLHNFFVECRRTRCPVEEARLELIQYGYRFTDLLEKKFGKKMQDILEPEEELNYLNISSFDSAEALEQWILAVVANLAGILKKADSASEKIKRYMEKKYMEELSLKEAADDFCMSPVYFSQYFKKNMGITFINYLNQIRIKKAKELLENTNLSAEDIAEKVGIQNGNYFLRLFKKCTGVTVGEYRRSINQHWDME